MARRRKLPGGVGTSSWVIDVGSQGVLREGRRDTDKSGHAGRRVCECVQCLSVSSICSWVRCAFLLKKEVMACVCVHPILIRKPFAPGFASMSGRCLDIPVESLTLRSLHGFSR